MTTWNPRHAVLRFLPWVARALIAFLASTVVAAPENSFETATGEVAAVTQTTNQGNSFTSKTSAPETSALAVPIGTKVDEAVKTQLELAEHYRHIRQPREAEPILIGLLGESSPEAIKQQALFELAAVVRDSGDLTRAEQIYAQFLNRWPNDYRIPEVLLHQGQLFREMGLNNLALGKFYAVMTSSLVLKNDRADYYPKLVSAAQVEIAETHFRSGKYTEAADFYSRLLKQNSPSLDRLNARYKLIRAVAGLERNEDTVARGLEFLNDYPQAAEQPEVRFLVALALKRLGRNGESLQQVMSLLKEQKERTKEHPELWAYWQQQAGNEIGNQLYREGDYVSALGIYLALAQINTQPAWQLPVAYQIGLTYERLGQSEKAIQAYQSILQRTPELGSEPPSGMQNLLEMARFRADFVQWHAKAETAESTLTHPAVGGAGAVAPTTLRPSSSAP